MKSFESKVVALASRLVKLDPRRGQKFLPRLVRQIANLFSTDRASLMLLDLRQSEFCRATYTGFRVPRGKYNDSNIVGLHVVTTGKPLVVTDIRREYPELLSPFADKYDTDAFVCFPLMLGDSCIGILSISNLESVERIRESLGRLELLIGVITQIVSVLELPAKESPRSAASQLRYVRDFARKLERMCDTDGMVHAYSEAVYRHYDVVGLTLFVDNPGKGDLSWMSLARNVSRAEAESIFDNVAKLWQEKIKSAEPLRLTDAMLIDPDRLEPGKSAAHTTSIKAFPLFLEQNLFGLVCVALSDEMEFTEDRLDFFNLLTFQLAVSLNYHLLSARTSKSETYDKLSGLYTASHFQMLLENEFKRSLRYKVPLGFIFVDVDHFKEISSTYGDEEAALVLKEIARIIEANSRSSDISCRYAGNKFVLLLPETNRMQSETKAERMKNHIANHCFLSGELQLFIKVTVSIGLASFLEHNPENVEQFIEFADTALYFAKRQGRNQVVSYGFVLDLFLKESGGPV